MDWLTSPEIWIALITLTALEIVLGIDNLVFISILAGKLPQSQQRRARQIGLAAAMLMRILLLLSLAWMVRLTNPLFTVFSVEIAGRDLILIGGGLFLIAKGTHEIHDKLEGEQGHASAKVRAAFWRVILQIMILDIVFSLDSVITAVGMVREIGVMVAAVLIAIVIMMIAVETINTFIQRHPTVRMLALSFLLLVGFTLVVEGLHQHIPKGYIYFAMAFSVFVESLNIRVRAKRRAAKPLHLRERYTGEHPVPEG
jgi:predicted tellurium resistance membrane protein TerC